MSSSFYKAYKLGSLRAFDGWPGADPVPALADDEIVYVGADLTVVRTPVVAGEALLWSDTTPRWQEFCSAQLGFEVPADLEPDPAS